MDINKLNTIFNELLEEWYSAESTVINDRSTSLFKDLEVLEIDRRKYKTRFEEALESS